MHQNAKATAVQVMFETAIAAMAMTMMIAKARVVMTMIVRGER